nr:PREDICTED: uncharacterized protein LOC102352931 [Latimeria chalumnae]|eukprot:XP_014341757.1 PREDICTED: uncharacterized protein LOC102352931 [Latimeria chalumnae]
MRERIAGSDTLILRLKEKLHESNRGDFSLIEVVQKIREASETELKHFQKEAEIAYSHKLSELNMRLSNDQVMLEQVKEENQCLHRQVDDLTAEVTTLESKLLSEEANNRTLIEKLELEQRRNQQHIWTLEARLQASGDWVHVCMTTNISLSKTDHLILSDFLKTHVKNWGTIPGSYQTQNKYLHEVFGKERAAIKKLVPGSPVVVIFYEMPDVAEQFCDVSEKEFDVYFNHIRPEAVKVAVFTVDLVTFGEMECLTAFQFSVLWQRTIATYTVVYNSADT